MEIITAREFRANQSNILKKAKAGESVLLSSRIGMFKITPVSEADTLTEKIVRGLQQIKLIEEGKLKAKTARDFLNEL